MDLSFQALHSELMEINQGEACLSFYSFIIVPLKMIAYRLANSWRKKCMFFGCLIIIARIEWTFAAILLTIISGAGARYNTICELSFCVWF